MTQFDFPEENSARENF